MDMAFLRRAERMLVPHAPARLDHAVLLASLDARRAVRPASPSIDETIEEPLIELLLSGGAWRGAVSAQCGCFNRAEAGRRFNAA